MPKLRVHNFGMSFDGYVAGPDQSLDNPLGVGGQQLHEWAFRTRTFRTMQGLEGGEVEGIDDAWRGWWGDEPPYHTPVFVLTHHEHEPILMEGGTTFFFVTDGIESALAQACDAAAGNDVRIGGGASTVRQYLRAGLVGEMHVTIAPVLLERGERLFEHVDGVNTNYECVEMVSSPSVVHAFFARKTN